MNELLRIVDVLKSYQSGEVELPVLKGLNLEVEKGVMVAISGESGSGKSTLLHLIGGMEKPDSGSIFFNGLDIAALQTEALARFRNRQIGFVFQFHHLLPEFTALENVMFPLLLRDCTFKEAEVRGRKLLEEVGLDLRSHHQSGELSGGEQQRVAVARALVGEPELLLADEPTGNLDLKTSESIHELLVSIHESRQLTSIIVTHNPRLASMCHQQWNLVDGQLCSC